MKLGISQLAFKNQEEFINSINYLKQNKILNVEIVLPKIVDWDNINLNTLQDYIQNIRNMGLTCTSTQSITFNTPLKSFINKDFLLHINKVSDLCKIIEVDTIVLGAPKLRDVYDEKYLSYVFKTIDSFLRNNDQILCIEPNCTFYGGKFFVNLDEIVSFIKLNNFTNIKTMIDTHNLLQENLNPTDEYIKYKEYIHHIHISEINLDLFKQSPMHFKFSKCLKEHKYNKYITYELINKKNINDLLDSINYFKNTYTHI